MTASSNTLELVFHDDTLLVVNKPSGLLAVPGRGEDKQDCLSRRVQREFSDALVVHRLDMATSGLMLFARGIEMQRKLSNLFQERKVQKRYVAVIAGAMEHDAGTVDLPIITDWPRRPLQKVDMAAGKHSLTRYRVLQRLAGATLVELEPFTGRTHQLRVHMAALGNPILGDALYGNASSAPRLLLHASALGFVHPLTGVALNFACVPPF